MSLAQANFTSPNRMMRYGQDHYDDRMQAIRRIVATPEEKPKIRWGAPEVEYPTNANTTIEGLVRHESTHSAHNAKPDSGHPPTGFRDPLTWFGILVPPALREAQKTFTSAIEGPLLSLLAAQRGMWEIEADIRRTRKAMKKARKA